MKSLGIEATRRLFMVEFLRVAALPGTAEIFLRFLDRPISPLAAALGDQLF